MKCIVPSPVCTDRKSSECHLLDLDLPHLVDPTPLALLSPPLLYQSSHPLDGSFPQAGTAHESSCLRSYFYFCCCDHGNSGEERVTLRTVPGYSAPTQESHRERKVRGSCSQHSHSHQQRDVNGCLSLLGSGSCLHSYRVQGSRPKGQSPTIGCVFPCPSTIRTVPHRLAHRPSGSRYSTMKAQFSGDSRLWQDHISYKASHQRATTTLPSSSGARSPQALLIGPTRLCTVHFAI